MPDLPDWSVGVLSSIRDPLYDLAEATVRLGYPAAYERSGNAVLIDDFSRGIASWSKGTPDPYATLDVTPAYSAYGGYTMKMYSSDPDPGTLYQRLFPIQNTGRWAVEVMIGGHDGINKFVITQALRTYTGGSYAELTIDFENDIVFIYALPNDYITVIDGIGQGVSDNVPLVLKLICDHENQLYSQLYFNEKRRNLRAYGMSAEGAGNPGVYELDFHVINDYGDTGLVWVDYVVVTTDEPDKVIENE